MNETDLNSDFQRMWQGRDPFEAAFGQTGESFRKVKSRHTFRMELEGRGYFVKLHRGCGWGEYFKNICQFKKPVTDAGQEYRALRHLKSAGVDTMTSCAYGCMGKHPAARISFLITEELTDTVSLEDYCRDWRTSPPPLAVKRTLIRKLGVMTGKMHRSGLNHRDCYICHFLLRKGTEYSADPALFVIDLHRAQIRPQVPKRYLLKDLGGLWFSAMDAGLTRHDLYCFLRAYFAKDLHEIFPAQSAFLRQADHVARKLYRKVHKKSPVLPF